MTIQDQPIAPTISPVIDPKTGRLTPDWEKYFASLNEWTARVTTVIRGL